VRISDRGDPVEAGQRGEIEVRGPTVFAGYLGDPGRPPNLSDDGWLRTGDLGYFDKDGFLFVLDRRDDLIVSGGENVYPAEVERVLLSHPNVRDVAVVGVPDDRWGAVPVAAVVWNGEADLIDGVWGNTSLAARGGQPSPPCPPLPARRERGIADGGVNREEASDHPEVAAEKELRAYCAQRLARFKIPARWLEFAELPRTGSGKVQRGRLREMVLERLADDSGSDR
jgi:O-succinylbenzoic acid--CoA ligase